MTVEFLKPEGTVISRAAVLNTTGLEGKLKYVTVSGDISQSGAWKLQSAATIGIFVGRSSVASFFVRNNL